MTVLPFLIFGGDEQDRTAGLLNAIQALSQLSYTPNQDFLNREAPLTCAFVACQQFLAWHFAPRLYNRARAGVVKLVDAGDSKSPFPCESVGSIPTSGTNHIKGLQRSMLQPFFRF